MARPASGRGGRAQFSAQSYMESQATNNAYYAGKYGYSYTLGNQYTDAAIKSGVVNPGGYTGLPKPEQPGGMGAISGMTSPTSRRNQPFDRFGNPTKQKGDPVLAQVLMGGYQFPGQAFNPRRGAGGAFMANELSMWMNSLGLGGRSPNLGRYRRVGAQWQDIGWKYQLSMAPKQIEKGESSIYQGFERYSTQETRMGTDATDPNAGFKRLESHSQNQHYISELSTLYKEDNNETGFARRSQRRFL